jgi:hypothetical protein
VANGQSGPCPAFFYACRRRRRTSSGEGPETFRTTRRRSHESLHGIRTHGAEREHRTLRFLCVGQVSSPDDGLRDRKPGARFTRSGGGIRTHTPAVQGRGSCRWNTPERDIDERSLWTESNGRGRAYEARRPVRGTQRRRRCEPPDDTLSGERQEALALERSPGIAPGFRAWRALVLLLNYDRKVARRDEGAERGNCTHLVPHYQ